jgi:hypothetical protein
MSQNKVALQNWHNEDVEIKQDQQGRAIINVKFREPSAKIILFLVK